MKPIPDPKHWDEVTLDPESGVLRREGIPSVVNPLDRNAVEAALQIRETVFPQAEVIIVSMSPPFVTATLKEMLAMGADRLVMLSDRKFAGSDTLATSSILAAGIKKIGKVDLILCGNLTLDGYTAQVSSQLAEFLSIPNIMHVTGLDVAASGLLRIMQKIENGAVRLESDTPLLISVVKEINKPRYIPFTGILEADSKEILVWSNEDLNLEQNQIGLGGSPTQVAGMSMKTSQRDKEILTGKPEELVKAMVERLHKRGIL